MKTGILAEAIRRSAREKRKQLSMRLDERNYAALADAAKKAGVSMNELLGRIIEVALEAEGGAR